ncbi:MAG: hypothetical protein M1379_00565 [Firmicutes bacterium]|nr:hypothetical protein [Bacillota bacterium]
MLEQELAKYPWLKPIALELFGGKLDPAKLRFPHNLLTMLPASPLHQAPASDLRDWTAIRAWARVGIFPYLGRRASHDNHSQPSCNRNPGGDLLAGLPRVGDRVRSEEGRQRQ